MSVLSDIGVLVRGLQYSNVKAEATPLSTHSETIFNMQWLRQGFRVGCYIGWSHCGEALDLGKHLKFKSGNLGGDTA